MAAIDPSAEPEYSGMAVEGTAPRATLKLVRQPMGQDDEEDDEDGSEFDSDEERKLKSLLNGLGEGDDEDDESSEDEEANGGPSDPKKTAKARREAEMEKLLQSVGGDDGDSGASDEDANGALRKLNKGKGVATGDEESSEGDSEDIEIEEFVICTLDPTSVCVTKKRLRREA